MRVFVEGVGLLGPGLEGWEASRALLAGAAAYLPAPTRITASPLLPPAERRRTGIPVKLALAVGAEAFQHAGRDAATTATVFTSSGGDSENVHQICETLASELREVSPTRFHNSVHNAPAGYWSIATRSRAASSSLCCHDSSFAAGLLEAATQAAVEGKPVALIAYDQPYPEPLNAVRPITTSFAAAFVIVPQTASRALAALEVSFMQGAVQATAMDDPRLEAVRAGVPAARSLPLLAAIARASRAVTLFDYGAENHLRVAVTPWP
jgi:hypothetical protein